MNIAYCTISSLNYGAQAFALAESFNNHAHGTILHWLIVDRKTSDFPNAPANIKIWWAEDLHIPNFEKLAFAYDVIEFNTLLKPDFLLRLISDGYGETAAYFDPDTFLFRDLEWLEKAHEYGDVILTPHVLQHPGTDSATLILRNGIFNLGFASFSNSAASIKFLKWWQQMSWEAGFNDSPSGLFVDQKWLNFAPVFIPRTFILRAAGANVAFWNLHERRVTDEDGAMRVNGEELLFFHFSGIKFNSKGAAEPKEGLARLLDKNPTLSLLVADYCVKLGEAKSLHGDHRYSFDFYLSGHKIHPLARRAYVYSEYRNRRESPFDPDSKWMKFAMNAGLIERSCALALAKPHTDGNRRRAEGPLWLRIRTLWRLIPKFIGITRYAQLLGLMRTLSATRNQGKIWSQVDIATGSAIRLIFEPRDD